MPAVVGKRVGPAEELNRTLVNKTRNRFRYLFMFHPLRWAFDEDDYDEGNDGFLPVLGRLQITPGVGGVGDGNVLDLARVGRAKEGWQIIEDNDPRLGPYRGYMQKFPAAGKQAVWGSIFESVNVVGNKNLWKHDDDAFRKFLRYLVNSGIVQPIDEQVRDMVIGEKRKRLENQIGRFAANNRNSVLATTIKRGERILDKMVGRLAPGEEPTYRAPGRPQPAADAPVSAAEKAAEKKPAPKKRRARTPKANPQEAANV